MAQQLHIDLLNAYLRTRGLTLTDADGNEASDQEVRDLAEILMEPIAEWIEDVPTREIDPNLQKHLVAATEPLTAVLADEP